MSRLAPTITITQLRTEALALHAEAADLTGQILARLRGHLEIAWHLGIRLVELKRMVGAGNWQLWLEANMPDLANGDGRQARRLMALANDNQGAQTVDDLCPDSVRKFRLGYVPAKERKLIDGDIKVDRASSHLTVLNVFKQYEQRVKDNLATLNKDEARRDLRPLFEFLTQLYSE